MDILKIKESLKKFKNDFYLEENDCYSQEYYISLHIENLLLDNKTLNSLKKIKGAEFVEEYLDFDFKANDKLNYIQDLLDKVHLADILITKAINK